MQIDQQQLLRAAIAVIIGGLILLGVMVLLPLLLPLIGVILVVVLLYFLYQWYKTGKFGF